MLSIRIFTSLEQVSAASIIELPVIDEIKEPNKTLEAEVHSIESKQSPRVIPVLKIRFVNLSTLSWFIRIALCACHSCPYYEWTKIRAHKQTISHLKALNFFMGSNPQIISIKDSTDMVNHFDTPLFVTVTTSKVHIFWEGHKILRNLHLTFDYSTYSQK